MVLSTAEQLLSLGLLCFTAAATLVNLVLRWFRWHFLTRRFGVRLPTRASFLLYFATLPALMTPFYLGEAVRSLLFVRRQPELRPRVIGIWLVERATDAAILGVACLPALGNAWLVLPALGLLWVVLSVVLARIERNPIGDRPASRYWSLASVLLGATALSWVMPMFALWLILNQLGISISADVASFSFSSSTLLGGISGVPLGIGVAGSAEILLLREVSASPLIAWSVALFRFGTVWFAMALGVGVLWVWRHAVKRSASRVGSATQHFDELAADYQGEIPEHIRDKLLRRKVGLMRDWLASASETRALRGLDLGCGQGWYANAMAQSGFEVCGVDASSGQIEKARETSRRGGTNIQFVTTSATILPFPDDTFDFAYAINVLHHILPKDDREQCFAEIVRVLKPGAPFFLHEINTENPLFRLYMSYIFPLLNRIDEGDERWLLPSKLPEVSGARWSTDIDYFTFLPDFVPQGVARALAPLETWLEKSPKLRRYSAHYVARLVKLPDAVRS